MVDAELLEVPEYAALGDKALRRVRTLLMKLDSDRRHGTDYFTSKFTGIVDGLFANLPKPVEWISYYTNDLPLVITIDSDRRHGTDYDANKFVGIVEHLFDSLPTW